MPINQSQTHNSQSEYSLRHGGVLLSITRRTTEFSIRLVRGIPKIRSASCIASAGAAPCCMARSAQMKRQSQLTNDRAAGRRGPTVGVTGRIGEYLRLRWFGAASRGRGKHCSPSPTPGAARRAGARTLRARAATEAPETD